MEAILVKVSLSSTRKVPEGLSKTEALKWVRGFLFSIINDIPGADPENAIPKSSDSVKGEIWFYIPKLPIFHSAREIKGYVQRLLDATLQGFKIEKVVIEE